MRDDFTAPTKLALKLRAGTICSNPDCGNPTTGPASDTSKAITVGEAAHITAASEGGPRFDPDLTPEQRSSAENGMWLCSNCSDLIDKDSEAFTVEMLKNWKSQREAEALESIRGCPPPSNVKASALGRLAIISIPASYEDNLLANDSVIHPNELKLAKEAVAYSNTGRLTQAIDSFSELSASSKNFDIIRLCWGFLYRLCALDDALLMTKRLASLATTEEQKFAVSHAIGLTLLDLGRPSLARGAFDQSIEIANSLGRKDFLAQGFMSKGLVGLLTGKDQEADEFLNQSLSICDEGGFDELLALNQGYLGQFYAYQLQDMQKAEKAHESALTICEEHDDLRGQALQLCNLGLISSRNGDDEHAEKLHRRALEIDEKIGWKKGIASHSGNIARILLRAGKPGEAAAYGIRHDQIMEEIGDYGLAFHAYHNKDDIPLF